MKSKIIFTGVVILVLLLGFIVSNSRQPTDLDMELAREYSRGYTDGYEARQKDYEREIEALRWKYNYMLELHRERFDSK